MRRLNCLLLIVLLAPATFADEPRTGAFQTAFTERSPLSTIDVQVPRFGGTMNALAASGKDNDYNLKDETFQVWVPETYKAADGWGLFVFDSPGGRGSLHEP